MPILVKDESCEEVHNLKWIMINKSKVNCIFSWPDGTLEFYLGLGSSYIVKFADVDVREEWMAKQFPRKDYEYWDMLQTVVPEPSDKCPEEIS